MRLTLFFVGILLSFSMMGCGGADSNNVEAGPVNFQVLSHGEVVDLTPHIKEGQVTLFDFYADWCPPCKKLDKSLVDMKKAYGDKLVIYKLDIVNWDSKLVAHHQIQDLPYLMMYGTDGKLVKKGPSVQVLPVLIKTLNQ